MQTVCNTFWDAGKGSLTAQNTRKPFGGRGSAPDPAEGAYSASANPLVGGEGLAVPSPRTPSLALGPSGLASSTPHSKISSDAIGRAGKNWTHSCP